MPNALRINVSGNNYRDAVFIGFDENASHGFDLNMDVWKLFGLENAPQLYTYAGDQELSVNVLPEIEEESILPLYFDCSEAGLYTMDVEGLDVLSEHVEIYIEDKKDKLIYDLKNTSEFSFNHEPDFSNERFQLIFIKKAETELSESRSNIWSNEHSIYINLKEGEYGTASIYSLEGKTIIPELKINEGMNVFDLSSQTGILIIKVLSSQGVKTEKVYLK